MLDVAIRRADGGTVVDPQLLRPRTSVPLPVSDALQALLPDGLRRGTTISVAGSLSLLLALLSAASADGAWCALVGFPTISAEAAVHHGLELNRIVLVPADPQAVGTSWPTAVGALIDAVDVVAVRPPTALPPGDIRRLTARARARAAVLMPYLGSAEWPGADVRLRAGHGEWTGLAAGAGRLRARRLTVTADGRGSATRPRQTQLWLPAVDGAARACAIEPAERPVAPVIELAG